MHPDPTRLEELPEPFPDRSGKGVRIAVIDSGVFPGHDHIDATRLLPGIAILTDGTVEATPDAAIDRLGHGTAVTAAIQQQAPGALCLPIRVFREGLRTSAAALIAAIRHATERRVDLINLSLGSVNAAHRDAFAAVAAEANEAGVTLVAAREADGTPCYPGMLEDVIGVALDWDCPTGHYRCEMQEERPILFAPGYPRAIPGVPQRRNLHGISFAVARMTGFAALACEQETATATQPYRVHHLRDALHQQALA